MENKIISIKPNYVTTKIVHHGTLEGLLLKAIFFMDGKHGGYENTVTANKRIATFWSICTTDGAFDSDDAHRRTLSLEELYELMGTPEEIHNIYLQQKITIPEGCVNTKGQPRIISFHSAKLNNGEELFASIEIEIKDKLDLNACTKESKKDMCQWFNLTERLAWMDDEWGL